MLLKRLYHRAEDGTLTVHGIQVLRARDRQHVSPNLIEQGVAQGWLSLAKGQLVIHGEAGAIVYRIDRPPGYYCCHCEAALDDGPSGADHVQTLHPTAKSPDPSNPAGYRRDHFFACTRVE